MQVSSANSAYAVSGLSVASEKILSDLAILRQEIPDDCSVDNRMDLQQQKRDIIENFIKERLAGAELDLSKTELNELDLTEANLRSANLERAKLKQANLARACLSGANLHIANLQDVTLKYARLANANLDYANFTNAKLNMATLSHAELRRTKLINADLSYANLNQTKMVEVELNSANLNHAKLMNAKLSKVNFIGATMHKANLSDSNLHSSIFIDTDLTDVNLTKTNLCFANFTNAKLNGANLSQANLLGAKLNGADLTGAKLGNIALPFWDETRLDTYLNHINNDFSLLTTIDSIDNKYNDKKIELVHQLIDSLDKRAANTSLSSVVEPLLDTLAKAPYNQDEKIINWLSNNILPLYLAGYDVAPMSTLADHVLLMLLTGFSNKTELMFSYNGAFIQCVLQAIASDNRHQQLVNNIYHHYLQDKRVVAYVNEFFGDGAADPDWSDKNANNFILLSARQGSDWAMLVSQNQLQQMLDIRLAQQVNMNWHGFYLYQGQENIGPANYQLDELFQHHFILFASSYQFCQQQMCFIKLLDSLELGDLRATFETATKQSSSAFKLVGFDNDTKLKTIFANKFNQYVEKDITYYRLTDEYATQLLATYQLTDATAQRQAEVLLCLSALFCKYSSSTLFGTEYDSPLPLRYFAFALMEQAYRLAPTTLGSEEQYQDWTNRLLGHERAFTCSAVLSNMMVTYIKAHFPTIIAGIMPPAWR